MTISELAKVSEEIMERAERKFVRRSIEQVIERVERKTEESLREIARQRDRFIATFEVRS